MSIGIKLGKFAGAAGALMVEGVYRGAVGAGGFAQDLVIGAEQGYAEKSAELLISRAAKQAAYKAKRDAAIAVVAKAEPVVAAAPVVEAKRGRKLATAS
jgi:hypothetical protein